jgi:hypothetical protein
MVRTVRHHDRDGVALELVETCADRKAEAGRVVRAVVPDSRIDRGELPYDLSGAVGTGVVDDE